MRIKLRCSTCNKIFFKDGSFERSKDFYLDINDANVYILNCNHGHRTVNVCVNLKSSLLYESALNAMHDHYLAEAVSTFYASFEYFYREVTYLFYHLSEKEYTSEMYDKLFDGILKQSERKIGAYYAIYLLMIGDVPTAFPSKIIEIRNKVIHGSHYPTMQETLNVGNAVSDYIWDTMLKIESIFPNAYKKIRSINKSKILERLDEDYDNANGYGLYLENFYRKDKKPNIEEYKSFFKYTSSI